MTYVLIRHGQSTLNAVNAGGFSVFIGQLDCPLSEEGCRQAEALRGSPALEDADVFFVSDLLRARQTAGFFAPSNKIVLDPRLRERSLGAFEGKTVPELQKCPEYAPYFTDPALKDFRHSFKVKAPGGESYTDVSARVGSFLSGLDESRYKKIVIVAHFCTIRCIQKQLLGLTEEETLALKVRNAEPVVIEK